jgi:hypothetical protein
MKVRNGRFLMRLWIAGSVALATYLLIAAPLVTAFPGVSPAWVAVAVPPAMVLALASLIAWLVAIGFKSGSAGQ